MGGDQGNESDFLFFDDLKDLHGLKRACRVNVYRGTDVEKCESEESGVDMAQRHDVQADVVLVEPKVDGVEEIKGNM